MPTSSQDILQAFERIRVFQRGEQRAVHKPLLILLALARIAQGAPRLVRFEDIEDPLKQLLTEQFSQFAPLPFLAPQDGRPLATGGPRRFSEPRGRRHTEPG